MVALTLEELEQPLYIDDFLESREYYERFEIMLGEPILTPHQSPRHSELIASLFRRFDTEVTRTKAGKVYVAPVGVRLFPSDIFVPDLLFVRSERASIVKERFIDGAPDLVVEVTSLATQRNDFVRKRATYQLAGVAEYWIVDSPNEAIRVFASQGGTLVEQVNDEGVAKSLLIPSVSVNCGDLFTDLW